MPILTTLVLGGMGGLLLDGWQLNVRKKAGKRLSPPESTNTSGAMLPLLEKEKPADIDPKK